MQAGQPLVVSERNIARRGHSERLLFLEQAPKASAHYNTKALWTLTMAIGQMCFWIPVALIAKPIPGKEPHWSSDAHQARGEDTQPCLTPKRTRRAGLSVHRFRLLPRI
jgi:hypothetical protein